MKNIDIAAEEIELIRRLEDFDLTMLLSEIHDHGWPVARQTLAIIKACVEARRIEAR